MLDFGGVVTPEIEHERLISRVLGVVYSGGNGAGLEKAHNLRKRAQTLNFGACRVIDREWRPKKARNPRERARARCRGLWVVDMRCWSKDAQNP